MVELLLTIFTGGGAVGLGSIFKMVSGFLDSYSHRQELRERRKILERAEDENAALAFQTAQFGETAGGLYARTTRRMLALMGLFTLSICTIHCTLLSDQTFVTLGSIASGEGVKYWSFLWGAITIPLSDKPLSLTLGHAALMNFIGFQMILGYYFTPGGRR